MKQLLILLFVGLSVSAFGQSKLINIECWEGEYKTSACNNCPSEWIWGSGVRVVQNGKAKYIYAPFVMTSNESYFTLKGINSTEFTGSFGLAGYTRQALQIFLLSCSSNTNPPQTLAIVGDDLSISGGNTITITHPTYAASEIINIPFGNVSSTNVQDAINELDDATKGNSTDILALQASSHPPATVGNAPDGFIINALTQVVDLDIDAEDVDISIAIPNLTASDVQGALAEHQSDLDALVGAEANVQSDWNETNISSDAFILNKPTVPNISWHVYTQVFSGGETSVTITTPTPIDDNSITLSVQGQILYRGYDWTRTGDTFNFQTYIGLTGRVVQIQYMNY